MEEAITTDPYTEKIKKKIGGFSADLLGIADVEPLKELRVDPLDLLEHFSRAVSIAIKLPAATFEELSDRPTPIYKSAYQTANLVLDQITLCTAVALQDDGHYSLPTPASQVLAACRTYRSSLRTCPSH